MKIKLYFGMENAIKKSGIGCDFHHQKKALTLNNIQFMMIKMIWIMIFYILIQLF